MISKECIKEQIAILNHLKSLFCPACVTSRGIEEIDKLIHMLKIDAGIETDHIESSRTINLKPKK